jgi:hypothetical protein
MVVGVVVAAAAAAAAVNKKLQCTLENTMQHNV